jgi:hypothetical protein
MIEAEIIWSPIYENKLTLEPNPIHVGLIMYIKKGEFADMED